MHEFTASIFKAFKAFHLKSLSALDLSVSLAAGRFCVVACQLPSPTQWNSTNCKCTLLRACTTHRHSGRTHAPWPRPPTVQYGMLSPYTLFFSVPCNHWKDDRPEQGAEIAIVFLQKLMWRVLVPQRHVCQELQQSLDCASINDKGLAREHSVRLHLPSDFDLTCRSWPHCHVKLSARQLRIKRKRGTEKWEIPCSWRPSVTQNSFS